MWLLAPFFSVETARRWTVLGLTNRICATIWSCLEGTTVEKWWWWWWWWWWFRLWSFRNTDPSRIQSTTNKNPDRTCQEPLKPEKTNIPWKRQWSKNMSNILVHAKHISKQFQFTDMRMSSKKKTQVSSFDHSNIFQLEQWKKWAPGCIEEYENCPIWYGDLYHKSWHFQDPHETAVKTSETEACRAHRGGGRAGFFGGWNTTPDNVQGVPLVTHR